MKQPKPMVGQTWNIGGHVQRDERTIESIDVQAVYWSGSSYTPMSDFYDEGFEFIPQNDLEWLAVKLDKWYCAADYLRNGSGAPFICDADHPDAISREQHRNERYRLGLDTKPHYKLINGQWSETK